MGLSYYLGECITYAHEPVQNHLLEHAGLDEITRPRPCLRCLSQIPLWNAFMHLLYLALRVLEYKTIPNIMIVVSNTLCYYSGCMQGNNFVDVAFYKALAVLVGFLLSFRATRANERRMDAYRLAQEACDIARDMVYLLPPHTKQREELKQILRFVFFNICSYFSYQYQAKGTKQRAVVGFNLNKIRLEHLEQLINASSLSELHISPKQLIAVLPPMLTSMVKSSRLEQKAAKGEMHQGSEYELLAITQLCRSYVERLMHVYRCISLMENTKTTSLYKSMLDITLFLFLAIFPWVMTLESVENMIASSLLVTFVYYGVDTVAEEVDDPYGNDITDIPLDDIVREAFTMLDYEDYISQNKKDTDMAWKLSKAVSENPTMAGSRRAWRDAMQEIVARHHSEVATLLTTTDDVTPRASVDAGNGNARSMTCLQSMCYKPRYGAYYSRLAVNGDQVINATA